MEKSSPKYSASQWLASELIVLEGKKLKTAIDSPVKICECTQQIDSLSTYLIILLLIKLSIPALIYI